MSGSNPTDPAGQDAPTEVERPTGLFGRRQLRSPKEALQPEDAPPPPQVSPSSRRRPALSAFSGFLSFLLIAAVGTIALIVWAGDEILRGVNPWRRLLGGVVLAVTVWAPILSR